MLHPGFVSNKALEKGPHSVVELACGLLLPFSNDPSTHVVLPAPVAAAFLTLAMNATAAPEFGRVPYSTDEVARLLQGCARAADTTERKLDYVAVLSNLCLLLRDELVVDVSAEVRREWMIVGGQKPCFAHVVHNDARFLLCPCTKSPERTDHVPRLCGAW